LNLCAINRPFIVFVLTITVTSLTHIGNVYIYIYVRSRRPIPLLAPSLVLDVLAEGSVRVLLRLVEGLNFAGVFAHPVLLLHLFCHDALDVER
jgi:hypothetical protein